MSATTVWPDEIEIDLTPDDIDPAETCAAVSAYGHRCGEAPNHEANYTPHICCLLGDEPEDGEVCNHKWTEPEE